MAADTAVEEAWRLALFPTASSARRYRLACFAQLVGIGVMLIALALGLAELPLTAAVFGIGFFMLWFSFVYLGVFAGRVSRRWQEAYMAMAEPPLVQGSGAVPRLPPGMIDVGPARSG